MLEIVKNYPKMCEEAIKIVESVSLPQYEFNKIIVCGMGGSAIGGDLLKDLLRERTSIPIEVSRSYHLPEYADEHTLVFCISYSGNTEETLSQFIEAIERKCKIITITSNGRLEKWCKNLKIPLIQVPRGFQPRASLPYLFFSLIICLQKLGTIELNDEIEETIQILKKIKIEKIKEIALSLKNSFPVIYAPVEFSGVARRVKTQLNENSKVLARYEIFPELNHNEIVGYENKVEKNSSLIILRDRDETEEMKKRIEITKTLIRDKVKSLAEIWAEGKSKLAKIMSLVFMGDVLSVELAYLRKVDPKPTKNIDFLKKELKKGRLIDKLEKKLIKISA